MIKTGIKKLDDYVFAVDSGKIEVCRWVHLAVERHFKDLEKIEKKDYPYIFNKKKALEFPDFCKDELKHYEGIMYDKPLILEPWQYFIYGSIFGWQKKQKFRGFELRRFKDAVIIIPKKNGKSILSGALGVFMIKRDGWPAAQCYTLAKNQSHARELGYRAAAIMAEESETVSEYVKINNSAAGVGIYCKENNSFYKPITSKPDSEDGRNVHFCGPDETKDWTDFDIYELMKNGTVNAPNSLFISTTTAGSDMASLGYDQQKYIEKVLKGDIEDDTTFGIIYGVDMEDKLDEKGNIREDWWRDKRIWKKANPNYEVSVFEDNLKELASKAAQSPSQRVAFQTKHLNIWHSSSTEFISDAKWHKCGRKKMPPLMKNVHEILEQYKGMDCYGAIDLGAVSDFSAFVIEFTEKPFEILPFFWIPNDSIDDRKNSNLVRRFVEDGWIDTTPGDWTDYDFIEEYIKMVAGYVNLIEITYDPWRMNQTVTHLIDSDFQMIEFRQGDKSMNGAVDQLENSVKRGEIEHFNNPVLNWMLGNVAIKEGATGLRKFDKEKAHDKIDGIVAAGMSHYRQMLFQEEVLDWSDFKVL